MALCIEATLMGLAMQASLSSTGGGGQPSTMDATLMGTPPLSVVLTPDNSCSASLSTVDFMSAMTGAQVSAYFSVSCPIEYIKSCFSLGGWDNDLGWDNNQGWRN